VILTVIIGRAVAFVVETTGICVGLTCSKVLVVVKTLVTAAVRPDEGLPSPAGDTADAETSGLHPE